MFVAYIQEGLVSNVSWHTEGCEGSVHVYSQCCQSDAKTVFLVGLDFFFSYYFEFIIY
jgi:hypothetical protein